MSQVEEKNELAKERDNALKKLKDAWILIWVISGLLVFYFIFTMFALRMMNTSFMSVLSIANRGAI